MSQETLWAVAGARCWAGQRSIPSITTPIPPRPPSLRCTLPRHLPPPAPARLCPLSALPRPWPCCSMALNPAASLTPSWGCVVLVLGWVWRWSKAPTLMGGGQNSRQAMPPDPTSYGRSPTPSHLTPPHPHHTHPPCAGLAGPSAAPGPVQRPVPVDGGRHHKGWVAAGAGRVPLLSHIHTHAHPNTQ